MRHFRIFAYVVLTAMIMASCTEKKKATYVTIETEFGVMKAELYNETPIHRDNFIKLAKEGYYDGTLFHRVMKGFMIQGGDPNSIDAPAGKRLGTGGPGYTQEAEIGLPHFKGTLAAARTGGAGNPEKRSSGSQFYIVQGKKASDAQLDNQERRFGFKYNAKQREKYKTVGGTPGLDMDYTVFGELVSGMEVIDKIAAVETDNRDRPLKDVAMKVTVD